MRVYVDDVLHTLPPGGTVRDAVLALSPFGGEPVTVVRNGVRVDADSDIALSEGDRLQIFPLLIGG